MRANKKHVIMGHNSPIGWVKNHQFNNIEIDGDFAHCISHNFIYDKEVEQEKLYNAQPCYYTDKRFVDGWNNFSGQCYLINTGRNLSLKSCIRRINKCRNIPEGTIIRIGTNWYYAGTRIDTGYLYKIKKENRFDIEYNIDKPEFFKKFTDCDFSNTLTDRLRQEGFIVSVIPNSNFLINLVNTAAAYAGDKSFADSSLEGEMSIAYGYGKKIGFSSHEHTLYGYRNGRENILWDKFGEFDKWSRCNEISKTTSINDIIAILKDTKNTDQ